MSECRHEELSGEWADCPENNIMVWVCKGCGLQGIELSDDLKRQRDEARAAVERLADEFGGSVGCAVCPMDYSCDAPVASRQCVAVIRQWAYAPAAVPKHPAVERLEKVIARIGWRLCPDGMGVGKEGCRIPVSDDGQRWESVEHCTPCWREACGLPAEGSEKDGESGE